MQYRVEKIRKAGVVKELASFMHIKAQGGQRNRIFLNGRAEC